LLGGTAQHVAQAVGMTGVSSITMLTEAVTREN